MPRNTSEVQDKETIPALKCPNCHCADPSRFQHLEEVTVGRNVSGFAENGHLEIYGDSDLGDEGYNERFHCLECYEDFPIPSELRIEWS